MLISGNIPFKTEVAAVHIYSQIQSDNVDGRGRLVDGPAPASRSSVLVAVRPSSNAGRLVVGKWIGRIDRPRVPACCC